MTLFSLINQFNFVSFCQVSDWIGLLLIFTETFEIGDYLCVGVKRKHCLHSPFSIERSTMSLFDEFDRIQLQGPAWLSTLYWDDLPWFFCNLAFRFSLGRWRRETDLCLFCLRLCLRDIIIIVLDYASLDALRHSYEMTEMAIITITMMTIMMVIIIIFVLVVQFRNIDIWCRQA